MRIHRKTGPRGRVNPVLDASGFTRIPVCHNWHGMLPFEIDEI
jgi:hypothetical protein